MAKKAVPGPLEEFVFPAELGQRLKTLRVRAGLTQAQLADQMGRKGKGGHFVVGRLERAKVDRPSLGLIADYLRACRAGFGDITDILDQYTRRQRVADEKGRAAVRAMTEKLPHDVACKVARYDAKTTVDRRFRDRLPEQPDRRLLKAQKLARSWLVRQRLEECLHQALNRMDVRGLTPERKLLADYGRMVFSALNKTRNKKAKRTELLDGIRTRTTGYGIARPENLNQIEKAVVALFGQLEVKGTLDILPTAKKAEELAGLPRSRRVVTEEEMHQAEALKRFAAEQNALFKFLDETRAEAARLLAARGVPAGERSRYLGTVGQFAHIASHTKPDSEERRKMIDDFLSQMCEKGCDPEIVLRIRDLTFERLSRRKP